MNTVMKIKRAVSCVMCLLIVTLSFFIVLTNRVSAYTIGKAEKIYDDATLDDNFCDSSLIVILDKFYSEIDTQSGIERKLLTTSSHINNLFKDVNVNFIKDLTALPEYGETLYNGEQFDVKKLREYLEGTPFKQILHVGLKERSKQNVLNLISKIEKIEGVKYVGPNFILSGASSNPNDPRLDEQWALGNSGIRANQAWTITTGSANVRVGVLDSGIQNHNDLNANTVQGWDFRTIDPHTGTFSRTLRQDIGGHGTGVAGIIGAVGNNEIGISGVAQKVSLVPLQTATNTSGSGSHSVSDIVTAITHARNLWNTDERIHILNFSISGFGTMIAILDAIQTYQGLFVWAAGNNGDNVDDFANIDHFDLANLISVGALDSNIERSVWNASRSSNYGSAVNIWAPGGRGITQTIENCLTTHSTGASDYRFFNGTSAATPYISGIAALMLSVDPNLSAAQIKTRIINHSDTINDFSTPNGNQTIKRANAYAIVRNIGHTHKYTHTWLNLRQHNSSCLCGDTRIRPHIVSSDWDGVGYATCLDCGGPAELGFVIHNYLSKKDTDMFLLHIEKYFGNDSYILKNGVLVLSGEDLKKYYSGILVLPNCCRFLNYDYYSGDEIVSGNHLQDCINCKHHESKIDDVYLYFDRRRFTTIIY